MEPNRKQLGSEEEEAPERRGFQDRVDLHLGAMKQLTQKKRDRGREKDNQKSTNNTIYTRIQKLEGTYA